MSRSITGYTRNLSLSQYLQPVPRIGESNGHQQTRPDIFENVLCSENMCMILAFQVSEIRQLVEYGFNGYQIILVFSTLLISAVFTAVKTKISNES